MNEPAEQFTLAERLAYQIRQRLVAGELRPGQRLSEAQLTADFAVSRNSLREAFRLLTKDGLLRHEANRGVFVSTPSMGSIIDIYRVRRVIECRALLSCYIQHPAVQRMRDAVAEAQRLTALGAWVEVGSANMQFHAAIVDLADSQRLNAFYAQVAAELRLSFGLLEDPEFLHGPYVALNADILALVEAGKTEAAAQALEAYLDRSERTVLAAFARSNELGK